MKISHLVPNTLLYSLMLPAAMLLLGSCSSHPAYNSELCEDLAVKIERRDSLSQEEYKEMIEQNEAILVYLIDQSRKIDHEPAADRSGSWRQLLANPEYMERFSYMFTIGSALYQADAEGRLDKDNSARYADLDRYNQELAGYSDVAD